MFYDENCIMAELSAVKRISWKGGYFKVTPRNYCALIYRIDGSGVFTVNGEKSFQAAAISFLCRRDKLIPSITTTVR